MIIAAGLVAILAAMALALVRAWRGPTLYDRILAVNVFGTQTVLTISLVSHLSGRVDVLDIALAYALINFIAIIAVLKFFEYGDLGRGPDSEEEL